MGPRFTPLDASLGARVEGVDLKAVSDVEWDAVYDAFLEHALLVFPGQHLTTEEQSDFGERFGKIEQLTPKESVRAVPLSNVKFDGSIRQNDDHFYQVLRGNEGWHTDSSYMPLAAKASMLSAHVVPPEGGQTEWADMRAAYDALDDEMQTRIADLVAHHSLYHSQSKIGHEAKTGSTYGFHEDGVPVRPLVKVHPETGRKALYIGRHAYDIPGLSSEESETLLNELLDFACQPPRVYAHQWEVGDLCVWDNRSVLHRARPYDYSQPRTMFHTRIAGDPRSELAHTVPVAS